MIRRDLPGGPVVKNLPPKAGEAGSITSQGTKMPHTAGQLSPPSTTGGACMWQGRAAGKKKKGRNNFVNQLYFSIK